MKKLLLLIIISFCIQACDSGSEKNQGSQADRLVIVATTSIIADALNNIVADEANVIALMGPGVDPHLFKPTPQDMEALRDADVIFYNGLHLEGRMVDILEKIAKEKPVVAVTHSIDKDKLIKLDEQTYDPHIWFDVDIWRDVVIHIGEQMAMVDPIEAVIYRHNAAQYSRELGELHGKIKEEISQIPQEKRVLVTAHDAFAYFGRAYQVEVNALQGISTVAEFGLRDIANLVDFVVERNIKSVFIESSIPAKSLEAVVEGCQEKGHPVILGGTLYADALGEAGTPEGTYIGMVEANLRTIKAGLL